MSEKTPNVPNSRRNLDIAINRILGQTANPLQVRIVIANTIIGQLLPKGAVKGGSSLKLRYGDKATRFTRDLDTFLDELDSSLKSGRGIKIYRSNREPKLRRQ